MLNGGDLLLDVQDPIYQRINPLLNYLLHSLQTIITEIHLFNNHNRWTSNLLSYFSRRFVGIIELSWARFFTLIDLRWWFCLTRLFLVPWNVIQTPIFIQHFSHVNLQELQFVRIIFKSSIHQTKHFLIELWHSFWFLITFSLVVNCPFFLKDRNYLAVLVVRVSHIRLWLVEEEPRRFGLISFLRIEQSEDVALLSPWYDSEHIMIHCDFLELSLIT